MVPAARAGTRPPSRLDEALWGTYIYKNNKTETGNSCWGSNSKCPLDTLAGYPGLTDAYRAPGFVLGLLRNFVGAAGFPPLLCAAGAANALEIAREQVPSPVGGWSPPEVGASSGDTTTRPTQHLRGEAPCHDDLQLRA